MAAIVLNNRDRSPLTRDQIIAKAPTVYADDAHESRSQRYLYVSTAAILDALDAEGFVPTEIRVTRTRDEGKRGHARHQIRLAHRRDIETWSNAMSENRGYHFTGRDGQKPDLIRPEVSLTNSHDGTSAIKGASGMFRLRCYNGLVAAEGERTSFSARHSAKYRDDIVEGVYRVLEETTGPVMAQVQEMRAQILPEPERMLLAEATTAMRWPEGAPIEAARMLNPRRRDDASADAWTTLNVLQENAIAGGIRYVNRNEAGRVIGQRTTRAVSGIGDLDRINRGIWSAVADIASSTRQSIIERMLATMSPEERAAIRI